MVVIVISFHPRRNHETTTIVCRYHHLLPWPREDGRRGSTLPLPWSELGPPPPILTIRKVLLHFHHRLPPPTPPPPPRLPLRLLSHRTFVPVPPRTVKRCKNARFVVPFDANPNNFKPPSSPNTWSRVLTRHSPSNDTLLKPPRPKKWPPPPRPRAFWEIMAVVLVVVSAKMAPFL